MKRKTIMIAMALACLLQQGCYTVVNRDGEYFASTKYANEEIDGATYVQRMTELTTSARDKIDED